MKIFITGTSGYVGKIFLKKMIADPNIEKIFALDIAEKPQGEMGFGWDPIFIPEGTTKTWANMSDDEKHQTSMRKIALRKLKEYLKNER